MSSVEGGSFVPVGFTYVVCEQFSGKQAGVRVGGGLWVA